MSSPGLSRACRRLLGTTTGISALVVTGGLLFLVLFGNAIWGAEAHAFDPLNAYLPMSADHPFGTDELGRDVLARTLAAARLTLVLAVIAAAAGAVVGIVIGFGVGRLKGRAGRVCSRAIDVMLAFPPILVALVVTTIIGPGLVGATASIAVALAPGFARVTSALTSRVSTSDFVLAAEVAGLSRSRIARRYVGLNIAGPLTIQIAVAVGEALIGIASLSFLGLGVQEPRFDWGQMLTDGVASISSAPGAAIAPALAIMATGLAFGLIGDVLADATDPRSQFGRHLRERRKLTSLLPPTVVGHTSEIGPDEVLGVDDLVVRIPVPGGDAVPVRGLSLKIHAGEVVGLVGESGSGKTMTALALAQILDRPARAEATAWRFDGAVVDDPGRQLTDEFLAAHVAMIFQDPMGSLNPALKLGTQVTEAARTHGGLSRSHASRRAIDLLEAVRVTLPERRLGQYPHELSGGMQQRVNVATALMQSPRLLIADEPTTALDVTVQAQMLSLLRHLNEETGLSILIVSHDMSVIAELCDRVVVMYAGEIVEEGPVGKVVTAPSHPYTQRLMAALPTLSTDRSQDLGTIPGHPPAATEVLPGCPFAPRCDRAEARCSAEHPEMFDVGASHAARCFFPSITTLSVPDPCEEK